MQTTPSSLTPCRECAQPISAQATSCPHCGAPFPAKKDWGGAGFEWKSAATIYGYPLVHIAFGRDRNRQLRVAKGVIAIGQFAIGLITFAQFGVGILFGLGQFMIGLTAIGQVAITAVFGIGQIATGYVAIGQFALGYYALCQLGLAKFIWTIGHKDPEAVRFFENLLDQVRHLFGR